jgi:hypothetical protein
MTMNELEAGYPVFISSVLSILDKSPMQPTLPAAKAIERSAAQSDIVSSPEVVAPVPDTSTGEQRVLFKLLRPLLPQDFGDPSITISRKFVDYVRTVEGDRSQSVSKVVDRFE